MLRTNHQKIPELKKLLLQNKIYLVLWLLFSVLLCGLLRTTDHVAGFLLLNPSWIHSDIMTWFFLFLTWLGDGIFLIVLVLISFFIFRYKKFALLALFSYALSGIFVQVLKHLLDARRPIAYLQDTAYPYFPGDIAVHTFNSFPSGHTATAFAWTAIALFCMPNKGYAFPLFLLALLVGYSRIFLGQHFPEDVLAGSAIGLFSAIVCFRWLGNIAANWAGKF